MADLDTVLRQELKKIDADLAPKLARRDAILTILNGSAPRAAAPKPRAKLTTMDMAREILNRKKREMNSGEIRREIVAAFKTEPAKNLPQMLYRRAKGKKLIYRTDKGYGLLAWKPPAIVKSAPVKSTAKRKKAS